MGSKKRKAVPNLLTSGNTPLFLHYKIAMLFEKTYQLFKLLNCKLLCNLRGEKSSSLYMQISFSSSLLLYIGRAYKGKNAHTPHKLSTTSQKIPLTFLLINLLLKLFTTVKSILQLVTR